MNWNWERIALWTIIAFLLFRSLMTTLCIKLDVKRRILRSEHELDDQDERILALERTVSMADQKNPNRDAFDGPPPGSPYYERWKKRLQESKDNAKKAKEEREAAEKKDK